MGRHDTETVGVSKTLRHGDCSETELGSPQIIRDNNPWAQWLVTHVVSAPDEASSCWTGVRLRKEVVASEQAMAIADF